MYTRVYIIIIFYVNDKSLVHVDVEVVIIIVMFSWGIVSDCVHFNTIRGGILI